MTLSSAEESAEEAQPGATGNARAARVAHVESLDYEGRGVAHVDGKTVFIEGALPYEIVTYAPYRKKPSFELAQVEHIQHASSARVTPRCTYFGTCGGCGLQHADWLTQVASKQRVLEENLQRIGKVAPDQLLPPIYGQPWGYRQRARLSARFVLKKNAALVGFHERRSTYVTDMQYCETLDPRIASLIRPLRELIQELSIRMALPQVEAAAGDHQVALVLRVMQPPTIEDEARLSAFAQTHQVQLWYQRSGPETAELAFPSSSPSLEYALPEFGVRLQFGPTEFTQVNLTVNCLLVRRALGLLQPQPGERIADLFCGLGNFTLAIASRGANVFGIEGSASAIRRAEENARLNQLDGVARFKVVDLYKSTREALVPLTQYDKLLIDPPRDGAFELVHAIGDDGPHRIVYVSCNPSTLARDADVLVNEKGFRLSAAGIINMFPHTGHVESIACFER